MHVSCRWHTKSTQTWLCDCARNLAYHNDMAMTGCHISQAYFQGGLTIHSIGDVPESDISYAIDDTQPCKLDVTIEGAHSTRCRIEFIQYRSCWCLEESESLKRNLPADDLLNSANRTLSKGGYSHKFSELSLEETILILSMNYHQI